MKYGFPPDIAARIDAKLKSGMYQSEDDVIRDALEALDQMQDDWEAVKEALDELDGGAEGVSVDEAFRRIRERHG